MKFSRRKSEAELPSEEGKAAVPAKKKSKKSSSKAPKAPKHGKVKGGKSFTLLVGDEGAILVYMQGATLVRRLFAPSPQAEHVAPLIELMKANPKVPLSILVDVIDQQYSRHTFPPVSSMSVPGLVKRRIERDFNAEDLKGALQLGRDTEGRKEWQYLIISITNTPLMQQWISLLMELPNPLQGIYLLPVEMQTVLPILSRKLGEGEDLPWKFLLTHNKVSGFRLVVLHEGKLAFTRISHTMEDVVPAVIAGNIEQEIISTIEYLRRLNYTENNELELIVIAAQEVIEVVDLKRFNAGAAHAVTPFDVAEAMQLKQAALSADRFGDVVVTALIATVKKRVLRFAPRYIDQLAQMYKAQMGLVIVAALIVLGILGLSATTALDMFNTMQAVEETTRQKADIERSIVNLRNTLNAQDKNVAYKAQVVAAYDAFNKQQPTANPLIAKLVPLLNDNMRVTKLEWNAPLLPPSMTNVLTGTGSAPTPPPSNMAGNTNEGNAQLELLMFTNTNDPEALSKTADAFIKTLKAGLPDYDVTVQPYSWATQKQASQEISLDATAATGAAAPNTIENKFNITLIGPHKPKAGGAR